MARTSFDDVLHLCRQATSQSALVAELKSHGFKRASARHTDQTFRGFYAKSFLSAAERAAKDGLTAREEIMLKTRYQSEKANPTRRVLVYLAQYTIIKLYRSPGFSVWVEVFTRSNGQVACGINGQGGESFDAIWSTIGPDKAHSNDWSQSRWGDDFTAIRRSSEKFEALFGEPLIPTEFISVRGPVPE